MSTAAPANSRALSEPPFLPVGTIFEWVYRRRTFKPGMPETAAPMRTVRHDERGLVGWLAADSTLRVAAREDGSDLRSDKATLFTAPRIQVERRWSGPGILRIAPSGAPWSVWLFHDPGTDPASPDARGAFRSWYVNLEDPARLAGPAQFGPAQPGPAQPGPAQPGTGQPGAALYSSDLVLDLVCRPDGTVSYKDEDELLLAVEQGRFSASEAQQIEQYAVFAEASFRSRDWPFDSEWTRWQPPDGWGPLPQTADPD